MSQNPARILGIDAGTLAVGQCADSVLFDPDETWTVDPEKFYSKARNTPLLGRTLRGRVKFTLSRGEIVYGGEENVL
jgi:dihydroorotase